MSASATQGGHNNIISCHLYLYTYPVEFVGWSSPMVPVIFLASLELQASITTCVDDVVAWMHSNRLQLNPTKTELLWSITSRRHHALPRQQLTVGTDYILSSSV